MTQLHSSIQTKHGVTSKIEDLKHLQRDIHIATQYMQREVRHEDVCIFMGLTRSGKSTLVNYLIGNKLVGERVSEIRPVSITKSNDPANVVGPQIGTGPTSETTIPSRWKSQDSLGLILWDVPGFDDNRGVVQDIINAFYVFELFRNVKSAKIVLVADIKDIDGDNIKSFLNLLNSVENILKTKMGECFPGIAIIFTKVPKEMSDIPVNKNYIIKLLSFQYLSSKTIDISEPAKNLIRHFIGNHQKIGLFERATLGDVTDSQVNKGIFEAINHASSISEEILKQVSPTIVEKSQLFLYRVRELLYSKEILMELQKILVDVSTASADGHRMMNTENVSDDKLYDELVELGISKKWLEAIDPKLSFHHKMEVIRRIDPSIEKFVDKYNLIQAAKLTEFCDELLHLHESKQFDLYLQSLLAAALANIDKLIVDRKLMLSKISADEAKRQSSELERRYKEEREQLRLENKLTEEHNSRIIQQLQNQIEMLSASQAEKDIELNQYLQSMKDEQIKWAEKEEKTRDTWRKRFEEKSYSYCTIQ